MWLRATVALLGCLAAKPEGARRCPHMVLPDVGLRASAVIYYVLLTPCWDGKVWAECVLKTGRTALIRMVWLVWLLACFCRGIYLVVVLNSHTHTHVVVCCTRAIAHFFQ
jgi:hypothetical protein